MQILIKATNGDIWKSVSCILSLNFHVICLRVSGFFPNIADLLCGLFRMYIPGGQSYKHGTAVLSG